jgi:hypothetical protein
MSTKVPVSITSYTSTCHSMDDMFIWLDTRTAVQHALRESHLVRPAVSPNKLTGTVLNRFLFNYLHNSIFDPRQIWFIYCEVPLFFSQSHHPNQTRWTVGRMWRSSNLAQISPDQSSGFLAVGKPPDFDVSRANQEVLNKRVENPLPLTSRGVAHLQDN